MNPATRRRERNASRGWLIALALLTGAAALAAEQARRPSRDGPLIYRDFLSAEIDIDDPGNDHLRLESGSGRGNGAYFWDRLDAAVSASAELDRRVKLGEIWDAVTRGASPPVTRANTLSIATGRARRGHHRTSGGQGCVGDGGRLRSGIRSNSAGSGKVGSIEIQADTVDVSQGGIISAQGLFLSTGTGGGIHIRAGAVEVYEAGEISTIAIGRGDAGDIRIEADSLVVSNTTVLPREFLGSECPLPVCFAEIQALTAFGGDGGSIEITVDELDLIDGGGIVSSTISAQGSPAGGLTINANRVRVVGVNEEFALVDPTPLAGRSAIDSSSVTLSSPTNGSAGNLRIQGTGTNSELIIQDGIVSSFTDNVGDAGSIHIDVDRVTVLEGGEITTRSFQQTPDAGNAGSIDIVARDTLHAEGGSISAESAGSDAGIVSIQAGRGVELLASSITAEVGGGPETTGGNITIAQPDWVILDNGSRIVANAFEGQGGNIGIETKALLVSSDSTISASSALGVSGVVAVNAPDTDIITGLSTLPQEFLDAAQLQRGRCGAPGSGDAGNFAVHESPGVPPPADAPLPSVLMEFGEGTPAMSEVPIVATPQRLQGCS